MQAARRLTSPRVIANRGQLLPARIDHNECPHPDPTGETVVDKLLEQQATAGRRRVTANGQHYLEVVEAVHNSNAHMRWHDSGDTLCGRRVAYDRDSLLFGQVLKPLPHTKPCSRCRGEVIRMQREAQEQARTTRTAASAA